MHHPFVQYLIGRSLISEADARQLGETVRLAREPIGMIAVEHGLLSAPQIDTILDRQRRSKERFGEIAVGLGFLTAEQVGTLVKIQEFRTAGAITEALALGGLMRHEDAVRHLGAFFVKDEEVTEMMMGD
jgi:hypothetical protein